MTERDHGEDRDYPDGSVGRYVREKWGAVPTRPARAARPYVQQVEPPAPRPVPDLESDEENAGEPDQAWAYQPDTAWPPRPESRPTMLPQQDGGGSAPSAPPRRPTVGNDDDTQTDRTQIHSRSTGGEPQPHDPFAGVAYGSDTWSSARENGGPDEQADEPSGPPPSAEDASAAREEPSRGAAGRDTASAGSPDDAAWHDEADAGPAGGDATAVHGTRSAFPGDAGPRDDTAGARPGGAGRGDDASAAAVHLGASGRRDDGDTDGATPGGQAVERHDTSGAAVAPGGTGRTSWQAERGPTAEQAAPMAGRVSGADWSESRMGFGSHTGSEPVDPWFSGRQEGPVIAGAQGITTPPSSVGRAASTGPFPAVPPGDAARAGRPPMSAPPRNPHWTDPSAVAAQEAQRARMPERTDLSSARLLRNTKRPPQSGWRRMIYVLSGRMINPGESPTDVRRRELTARVNQPLLGCYKIAMLSLKGGVGKTTMTATLGATFASLRGDRVVAVDANPDRGTLSQKIPLETSATVRNLLRDAQRVRRYTDVRAYTSQGPSRLEVLASEQDPAVSEAFSEEDYRRTVNLLEHFYNIVLTDCGTGLMHSAMYGVLGVADQLVIVSSGSIDGARSASATMDWLDAHGHGELVANSVVVINFVHRSRGGVDLDRVSEHFAARCRAVVRIPFDAHLEEGAEIDLDRLEPNTRMALLDLAANVADAFNRVHAL